MKLEIKSSNTRALKIALCAIFFAFLFNKIYQPLPDDFEQPWKYRLICFGADLANHIVSENMVIFDFLSLETYFILF
jgi:hypothetical protein